MINAQELGFEQALEKLQIIVKQMESGELNLEASLKAFEEGVSLARICQTQLTAAEQKVEVLTGMKADQTPEFQPLGDR